MCRETKCSKCGNAYYAGCGQHVDSVKQRVEARGDKWCTCASSAGAAAPKR